MGPTGCHLAFFKVCTWDAWASDNFNQMRYDPSETKVRVEACVGGEGQIMSGLGYDLGRCIYNGRDHVTALIPVVVFVSSYLHPAAL